ncbi:hypothetical protein P7D15_00175 [Bacillus cereus]|uniref:DUF2726 domain-containing protein n=1 Tax=Bacillus cereus TaxID=1396 RepID=UPI002405740B|nr:hypothetical protein [Bacillus cereus]MDF9599575.1 hypothetical protein [Bacillus cereus]MDG1589194.1 hypothetical protein [Bacillus cereus]
MTKKKTHEEFVKEVKTFVGNDYVVIGTYRGSKERIRIKHLLCNHEWDVFPYQFLHRSKCSHCGKGRKTKEQFQKDVSNQWGDEYIVIGEYINNRTKVQMKHLVCGREWAFTPLNLKKCKGCTTCNSKRIKRYKKTHADFIKEVYENVKNEYKVLGTYKNNREKILMQHTTCGNEWLVTPKNFLTNNSRCPACNSKQKGIKDFKKKVNQIVGDEYIVVGEYINNKTKIRMLHRKCGEIVEIAPNNFSKGCRCSKCSSKKANIKKRKTHAEFVSDIYRLEGDKYSVIGKYIDVKTYVSLKHNECGHIWDSTPHNFFAGRRCPKCRASKGEKEIEKFLQEHNIVYKSQYIAEGCRYKRDLRFDFGIFSNNNLVAVIEYDGQQHITPVSIFGGKKAFETLQKRDEIKNNYCKVNGIKMFRIPFWDIEDIDEILSDLFIPFIRDTEQIA